MQIADGVYVRAGPCVFTHAVQRSGSRRAGSWWTKAHPQTASAVKPRLASTHSCLLSANQLATYSTYRLGRITNQGRVGDESYATPERRVNGMISNQRKKETATGSRLRVRLPTYQYRSRRVSQRGSRSLRSRPSLAREVDGHLGPDLLLARLLEVVGLVGG
jgi:hypothetical protein